MPFLHYSEQDVQRLLSQTIPLRWPREVLLFVTGCRAERSPVGGQASPEHEAPAVSGQADRLAGSGWWSHDGLATDRRGYLAATQARLIYQDRTTPSSIIRSVSVGVAATGVAVLVAGHDLLAWFVMSAVALLLWMVARVVEAVTAGSFDIEFDKIVTVENGSQRMVAVGRHDSVLTLHIDDPSDFRMVATLVLGNAGNAAA